MPSRHATFSSTRICLSTCATPPSPTDLVSEDFVSAKADIACFGSMMYEIYVVLEIEANLHDDPEFEDVLKRGQLLEKLPDTTNVFSRNIIRRCWVGDGLRTMQKVCHALDDAEKKPVVVWTVSILDSRSLRDSEYSLSLTNYLWLGLEGRGHL